MLNEKQRQVVYEMTGNTIVSASRVQARQKHLLQELSIN